MHHQTTVDELESILEASERAAAALRGSSREQRATYLRAAADGLDASVEQLVPVGQRETHLPEGRLRGELQRTTFQLRLIAEVIEDGSYLDARVDHADDAWPMGAPRPDLRRTQVPLGPVAVFSASNFPFAFSVAGGDSASALAAGCPVVVKAHDGHRELSAMTGEIVARSLREAGAPDGAFAVVFGTDAGIRLVQHERIAAAGFTGSIQGGRALFDLAQARPVPIPFYGELGSNNPVFVTEAADRARGTQIAEQYVGSFTLGSGQFCTKPGAIFVPRGSRLLEALRETALPQTGPLLNERIREGYLASIEELQERGAEQLVRGDDPSGDVPSPILFLTDADAVLADPSGMLAECFGPASLVVEYDSEDQLPVLARALDGQLTATVHGEEDCDVTALVDALSVRAGRVLWNQWPTGVSVTYAQQHGGPYPASTASSTTSVGTAAIFRFVRPVAFQGFPERLLPDELREQPERSVSRMVDGARVS